MNKNNPATDHRVKTKVKQYDRVIPGRVKMWFEGHAYICDEENAAAMEREIAEQVYPHKYKPTKKTA